MTSPCHWGVTGVVNGGCGYVGRPHPSHPFTTPHPTVYETSRTTRKKKKLLMDEISADEKSMFTRWRGWLFIWLYESICVGFWRYPEGSQSSQCSPPNHNASMTQMTSSMPLVKFLEMTNLKVETMIREDPTCQLLDLVRAAVVLKTDHCNNLNWWQNALESSCHDREPRNLRTLNRPGKVATHVTACKEVEN